MKSKSPFILNTGSSFLFVFAFLFISFLAGCDAVSSNTETSFRIKFENDSNSEYSITNIQVQKMGHVENSQPSGTWSSNVLPSGTSIAPGGHVFFELDIPNGHYDIYRVGVNDGSGNQIMLHEQSGYSGWTEPSITHWGADDRTCSLTIKRNSSSGLVVIQGWSDQAGIE